MKKFISSLVLISLTLSCFAPLYAQQAPTSGDDDVVRITSNLVQMDTIVTDKDGKPVTDLTAADFEILQDGKPQKITFLSYVNTEIPKQPAAPARKTEKNAPLPPPASTRAENAGRIITFVVDDGNCSSSRIGMRASREALEKFVSQQMRPDDLVAIYQTRGGSSLLRQFTSDKAQLMGIVRKIRWYPPQGMCANEGTGDFFDPARISTAQKMGGGTADFDSEQSRANRNKIDNRARDNQVAGLVGVLSYITRGLQSVAGRKTVFLLSDGLPLMSTEAELKGSVNSPSAPLKIGDSAGILRDLIDSANRASVVFNTIDVRGVQMPDGGISAQDAFTNMAGRDGNINETSKTTARRASAVINAQTGLFYLANETGGRFYDDTNDLSAPVRQALNLEKGYYLIGYQPDENTFKSKKFNKIEVRVKRPELKVRTRSGFYGVTDESLQPKKRTGDSELYEALVAPLPNAGLNLHLTAFFGNTPAEGSFVRTLLHLDAGQVAFTDEANGMKKAVFDVVAVTMNEKNEVVDEFNRTHTLRFPAVNLPEIRRNGLIYMADVPVKKAGVYNFRVAVRDAASRSIGAAGQQIEVPDLKKNELFLSGLTIGEFTLRDGKPVMPAVEKAENAFAPVLVDVSGGSDDDVHKK